MALGLGLPLGLWRGPRAILLPLFGAAIGAIGALVYTGSAKTFPISAIELVIAALWGVLAFPYERRSIGVVGAIVIAASIAARWFALEALVPGRVLEVFIAAQTVPRAAIIALAWVSRPAGTGIVYEFSSTLTTPAALIAMALGTGAALLCGLRPGAMILVGAYLIIRAVRWFSYRYIGGVNANSFGATQLLIEMFVLVMFTCAACRW